METFVWFALGLCGAFLLGLRIGAKKHKSVHFGYTVGPAEEKNKDKNKNAGPVNLRSSGW